MTDEDRLAAEQRARVLIDRQLADAGWVVRDKKGLNLFADPGADHLMGSRWDDVDFAKVPIVGMPPPTPPGEEPTRLTLMAPMAVPENADQICRVSVPAPWGAAAIGLITNVKGSPKPILSVGYEWPFAPLGISPGLTKRESERLQLQLYVQDVWEGHGSPPFTVVEEGDRPDFQVRNARGIAGLDVTRLTSPIRRRAHDLFLRLKGDIETDPRSYSRLQGHMVNVWFADGLIPGAAVPPKRGDAATCDAIRNHLALLAGARSNSEPWIRGHPVSIPTVNAGFNVIPLDECYPGTHFYGERGFEMGLTFGTHHTSDELWLEVQRLADQHDYEGAGTLVVSVGAPAAPGGEVFPSDYLLWDSAEADYQPLKDLTFLSTVMVHDWWLGSVRKIYPTNELIVHPRRSGPVFPIRLPLVPEEVVGWQTQNIHEPSAPHGEPRTASHA